MFLLFLLVCLFLIREIIEIKHQFKTGAFYVEEGEWYGYRVHKGRYAVFKV